MARRHILAATVCAVLASTAGARAQPGPDRQLAAVDACVLSDRSATSFDDLGAVPEVVRKDLLARTGPLASRDQAFNSTDMLTPSTAALPTHRFLRAAHSGLRWLIWYEHGGIGDHVHLAVYVIGVRGSDPTPVAIASQNFAGSPCAAADAVLHGVRAASPTDW